MARETVIGSIREAIDFLGFGVEVDGGVGRIGHVAYAPPGWARHAAEAHRALVFFDELTTAPPSVRKAMMRVLQERYAGDFALPDTVALVAAANPSESAVDGYDLEPPMANRMIHLDFDFPQVAWLDGLIGGFDRIAQPTMEDLIGHGDEQHRAQVHGTVTAFLRARPDLVEPGVPTDPVQAGRAWPSRRSWTNAIAALSELRPEDADAAYRLLSGAVGEGPAREYLTFRRAGPAHPGRGHRGPRQDQLVSDATRQGVRRRRGVAGLRTRRSGRPDHLAGRHPRPVVDGRGRPARRGPGRRRRAARPPTRRRGGPRRVVDAFADLFVGIGRWAA